MAELGTANGDNSFEYFESCLVSLVRELCSQICASHAALHLTHSDVNAGVMFGLDERKQRPSGCAETDMHQHQMHVGSSVAVRVFV